ncbi:transposase InsO family protein [Bradyrhizobium sp. LM2.7]
MRSAISSRSTNERYRPESAFAEDLNIAGGMPPAFRNNLLPTGCDNPASSAASSLLSPAAIARQKLFCSSRPATDGRPGDGNGARPDRADRRLTTFIATSNLRVLRQPFESAVDWFNNRRLLEPIGNIPPAEAEQRYYTMLEQPAMAA